MALNENERESVRYYCGYGLLGQQALPANGYRFSTEYGTLEYKMTNLQVGEENRIRDFFLPRLETLDQDTFDTRINLDTTQAAVWSWNQKEIKDRARLFNDWRLKLCNFLGIQPGDGLFKNGGAMVI